MGCYCKSCGYDLVSTASSVCPECAHAFDRDDPSTFDSSPRRLRQRRRWRHLLFATLALAAIVVLFPRGYAVGTFTTSASPSPVKLVRFELAPPIWLARLGVPYPGWTKHDQPNNIPLGTVEFEVRHDRFTQRGITIVERTTARGPSSIQICDLRPTPETVGTLFATHMREMFIMRARPPSFTGCAPFD